MTRSNKEIDMITKQRPRIRIFWTQEDADKVAKFRRESCGEITETRLTTYGGKPAVKLISYPA